MSFACYSRLYLVLIRVQWHSWKCAIGSLYLRHQNVVFPYSLVQWLTMTKKQNQNFIFTTHHHHLCFSFFRNGVPIPSVAHVHTSSPYSNLDTFHYQIHIINNIYFTFIKPLWPVSPNSSFFQLFQSLQGKHLMPLALPVHLEIVRVQKWPHS